MKLQEYRSKEILARHGVPLLAGETATSPEEARAAAGDIGRAVVVKAQVLVGVTHLQPPATHDRVLQIFARATADR